MKLVDLEPRWIHPNVMVFLCPCCRKMILTCKDKAMSSMDQFQLLAKELPDSGGQVVPTKAKCAWKISTRDFATMTITPSIDASASGHWHGFITDGEIVGGLQS